MFTLKGSVQNTGSMSQDDLIAVTMALRALGHYDHPDRNDDPLADGDFFKALAAFQAANGLAATGQMARMDPTHVALKSALRNKAEAGTAFQALRAAYDDRCDARDFGE